MCAKVGYRTTVGNKSVQKRLFSHTPKIKNKEKNEVTFVSDNSSERFYIQGQKNSPVYALHVCSAAWFRSMLARDSSEDVVGEQRILSQSNLSK